MTFVPLALSKDTTTYIQLDVHRETIWKKRLSLRKRRPSDQIPPHNLNNHHFIYILGRLSSKKRKDRESAEYRSKQSLSIFAFQSYLDKKTAKQD